jgi:hypothetical protein
MVHQKAPLEAQGLRLAKRTNDMLRDDRVYATYADRLSRIEAGDLVCSARPPVFAMNEGGHIYFAHQLRAIGAEWLGEWGIQHHLGFGPFAFKAGADAQLHLKLSGSIDVLFSGPDGGGSCRIRDLTSGYEIEPEHKSVVGQQQFINAVVPCAVSNRKVVVDRITPGSMIFGIRAVETQPINPRVRFDLSHLFPAASEGNAHQGQKLHHDDKDCNDKDRQLAQFGEERVG